MPRALRATRPPIFPEFGDVRRWRISEIKAFRRELHRNPEVSGEEVQTALRLREELSLTGSDCIVADIGGHGLAAVYEGAAPGPTIMIRAELDGLPIDEISDVAHRSTVPGKGHLCGHDGHMAILMALAKGLGQMRPARRAGDPDVPAGRGERCGRGGRACGSEVCDT